MKDSDDLYIETIEMQMVALKACSVYIQAIQKYIPEGHKPDLFVKQLNQAIYALSDVLRYSANKDMPLEYVAYRIEGTNHVAVANPNYRSVALACELQEAEWVIVGLYAGDDFRTLPEDELKALKIAPGALEALEKL